jgi:16S rRNA (guanine527-N7)-methyltransferase
LGKTGKEILSESLTKWQFEYKEKKSITNEDSFLIKITNLKKRMDRKIISVINQKGGVR